jgi:hypothetical protein
VSVFTEKDLRNPASRSSRYNGPSSETGNGFPRVFGLRLNYRFGKR